MLEEGGSHEKCMCVIVFCLSSYYQHVCCLWSKLRCCSNILCSLDFLFQSGLVEASCRWFFSHIIIPLSPWLWKNIWVVRHFPQSKKPLRLTVACDLWFMCEQLTRPEKWCFYQVLLLLLAARGWDEVIVRPGHSRLRACCPQPLLGQKQEAKECTEDGTRKKILGKYFLVLPGLGILCVIEGQWDILLVQVFSEQNKLLGSSDHWESQLCSVPSFFLDTDLIPLWVSMKWEQSLDWLCHKHFDHCSCIHPKLYTQCLLLAEH
jgi:hypothetical protein